MPACSSGGTRSRSTVAVEPALQPIYDYCFVCGTANPQSLGCVFRHEAERVVTEFVVRPEHQGYPGYCHGGVLFAVLDETTGRAAYLRNEWVRTGRIEVRYHAPVPVGSTVRVIGEIVKERGRAMELRGRAEIVDGPLVAEASGLFMKLTGEQRATLERLVFGPPVHRPTD